MLYEYFGQSLVWQIIALFWYVPDSKHNQTKDNGLVRTRSRWKTGCLQEWCWWPSEPYTFYSIWSIFTFIYQDSMIHENNKWPSWKQPMLINRETDPKINKIYTIICCIDRFYFFYIPFVDMVMVEETITGLAIRLDWTPATYHAHTHCMPT